MPAPSTIDEFLDLARKSGVVDEQRLDAYVRAKRAAAVLPGRPAQLAGAMIRDGLVTQFQAEQLLLGKCRRFTIGGKYKILERVGSGGMGSVYLCEHIFLRRKVAIKVLPPAQAGQPSALERFYREARAVAALDHPNIVRAHDIDREDKLHFLVMEYVDGASLQEIVKKHGPMDVTRACHYILQAARGLDHAYHAGVVHRDIKPGNILIHRNGTVKVLDMGLARFFKDESDNITKKHDEKVLGTTDYLAPEQALASDVDIRADIYSLGATFYFMLAGKPPFSDGTLSQKLIWHQTRQPKPLRSLRPEVPAELAAVVEKMMAKDPANRYQVPAEVLEALAPWTRTAIPPPPEQEMPRLCAACREPGQKDPASWPPIPAGSAEAALVSTPNVAGGITPVITQPQPDKTPVVAKRKPTAADAKPVNRPKTPPPGK